MAVTSQVVQSQLPASFETYFKTGSGKSKGLIPQAFELYGKGTPEAFKNQYVDPLKAAGLYGAGRIAGLSDTQKLLGTEIKGMTTPGQFQSGTDALSAGYGALSSGLPSLVDPGVLAKYMSPYTQNVVDIEGRKAIEAAQKAQLLGNLGAARKGQLGGSAQILAGTERERALQTQLGDIQSRGLQASFEAAQKGIESDRTSELQRAETLAKLGSQFGTLGAQEQTADIDRLKTLGAYGDLERSLAQQGIDVRFADLIRGMEFPEQQLDKLSGFIRGIPMTDRVETKTTPPPSFASQLSSMGIAGLGLYRQVTGGQGD